MFLFYSIKICSVSDVINAMLDIYVQTDACKSTGGLFAFYTRTYCPFKKYSDSNDFKEIKENVYW